MGLVTANKAESQEVCFIPDDDHTRFVREHLEDFDGSGDIVSQSGEVLGQHNGYYRFTIGQRRGIGVAAGFPLYVLAINPESRQVTVGPADALLEQGLLASGMNWFRAPRPGESLEARIRYRGGRIPVQIEGEEPCTVRFSAPARAIAPGQAVVLYSGDEVLGGGWIQETLK